MYVKFNPNPLNNRVGDCTVRAISKATGQDWDTVYTALCLYGFMMKDMPTSNRVWGAYLRKHGYKRHFVDDNDKIVYTVEDFCKDNPKGIFILSIDGHVVCIEDGNAFDSWDSLSEIPVFYWVKEE